MNPFLFYLVFFESVVLLESTFHYFPFLWVRIDLIWLTVLTLGFYVPFTRGIFWVFLLGLVQETLGAPLHGTLVLPTLVVFSLLRLTHRQLFFQGRSRQMIWVFFLTLFRRGLEQSLLLWQGYETFWDFWYQIGDAVLNGVAAPFLFTFLRRQGRMQDKSYASRFSA